MNIGDTFAKWKAEHRERRKFGIPSRIPFYDLAAEYLPTNLDATVLDIGPGEGHFAEHVRLKETFPKYALLEGNNESVSELLSRGFHAQHYLAPGILPYAKESVAYIHLSHIVEHLPYEELYIFLKEADRVLENGGILVISTPLLWNRFYDDLSHVKPYNPSVFINYLTQGRENATQEIISMSYSVRRLQYRYRAVSEREWTSRFFVVDVVMRMLFVLRSLLGFRRYIMNGYTLILEKGKN